MATQNSKSITIDELTNIVKDPDAPPDVIVLSGFVGESSRKEYIRLYLTPELNDYVEIHKNDVHHQEQIPKEKNNLGGSHLWVNREANVIRKKTESRTMQADFLKGEIFKEQMAAAYHQVEADIPPIIKTQFGNSCDRYCFTGKAYCKSLIDPINGCRIDTAYTLCGQKTCNWHICY